MKFQPLITQNQKQVNQKSTTAKKIERKEKNKHNKVNKSKYVDHIEDISPYHDVDTDTSKHTIRGKRTNKEHSLHYLAE